MQSNAQFVVSLPRLLKVFAWAAILLATLSIANAPGNWGHSICGPWGCGPPLQALLACHLAWLVVLAPIGALLARSERVPPQIVRRLGMLFCIVGVMLLGAVVIYQRVVWQPSVSEWHSEFFWQRCGFVLVTMIDVPVAQILLLGAFLVMIDRRRRNV